jgi:hypothetical protein
LDQAGALQDSQSPVDTVMKFNSPMPNNAADVKPMRPIGSFTIWRMAAWHARQSLPFIAAGKWDRKLVTRPNSCLGLVLLMYLGALFAAQIQRRNHLVAPPITAN